MRSAYFKALSFALLLQSPSMAQKLLNPGFDELDDSSSTGLAAWDRAWGSSDNILPEGDDGNRSLLIRASKSGSVGFVEQKITFGASKEVRLIKLTGEIAVKDVEGRGAGLNLAVYDSAGTLLTNRDMGYASFNWATGSADWRKFSIASVAPANADYIKIGAILYGTGEARFDDFQFESVATSGRVASEFAQRYVSAACDTIMEHSLYRDSVTIEPLRKAALEIAGHAVNAVDCYPAIVYLLGALGEYGDHHSFLMTADEVKKWESDDGGASHVDFVKAWRIEDCGYLQIPPFHDGSKPLMVAYADSLQSAIGRLEAEGVAGWIVDLRLNTGGNMQPMIVGLGPLFDSEILGAFVDVRGERETWGYRNGTYYWNDSSGVSTTHSVKLKQRRPIAVLIGSSTGSSGEVVAISFIGNGNTKLFGQPTWGLTTGNGGFDLPDGARMMLASTRMTDRNGKLYASKIEPDETTDDFSAGKEDPSIRAGIDWIKR